MITVIAIIGILTTIAVPQINKYIYKANETKIYSALSQLNNTAILMYTSSEYEEVKIETIIQELGKENLGIKLDGDSSHFKLGSYIGNFEIEEGKVVAKMEKPEAITYTLNGKH